MAEFLSPLEAIGVAMLGSLICRLLLLIDDILESQVAKLYFPIQNRSPWQRASYLVSRIATKWIVWLSAVLLAVMFFQLSLSMIL